MQGNKFMKKCIVLMGIKHCGKSTQANFLSEYFKIPSFDTDDLIFELTGKTPRQIYTELGEEGFKNAEKSACIELKSRLEKIQQTENSKKYISVAATGGGICNNAEAIKLLSEIGILIFLNADERTAANRIVKEVKIDVDGKLFNLPAYIAKENPRTISDVRESFHKFYIERQKIYRSICNICVDMKNAPKSENRDSIIESLSKTE